MYFESKRLPALEIVDVLNISKYLRNFSYATAISKCSHQSILCDGAKKIHDTFGHDKNDIPVLIRAYNEKNRLPTTLLALSMCISPKYKIRPIVINNASTDGTQKIASVLGADVIDEPTKGFGHATNKLFEYVGNKGFTQFFILDADCIPVRSFINYMLSNLTNISSGVVYGLRGYIGGQYISDNILTLANVADDVRFSLHKKTRVHGGGASFKLDQNGQIIKGLSKIGPEVGYSTDKEVKKTVVANNGLACISFDQRGMIFADSARFPDLRSVFQLVLNQERALQKAYSDWGEGSINDYKSSLHPD